MRRVREAGGLSYSIGSDVMGVTAGIQGAWLIHMIVNPVHYDEAVKRTREEVQKFVAEGVGGAELEDKKNTLIGRFKVGLSTTDKLAHQILRAEELEMGYRYLDQYTGLIRALDVVQVNNALRRYYNPDLLHWVAAGNRLEKAGSGYPEKGGSKS
jgi:predicted Zn-dependent peptidase